MPPTVQALVARARAARQQQDSLLAGYEAIARQRMSSSIGVAGGSLSAAVTGASIGMLGAIGASRLAARYESVARVGWDHSLGAWGEIIGSRAVVPIVGMVKPQGDDDPIALVLPFYPGRDRLWPTSEIARDFRSFRDWIVHPLSDGADSVYDFSAGDSLDIHLPDKHAIHLREIRVRARRPSSRLIVGSLWVDTETGHLVRAAYRPSVPVDLWPFMAREIDKEDQAYIEKLGPFTGVIREIIIENGLYEGRFWLPKTRTASGEGAAKTGRITLSIEQSFEYTRVTAIAPGTQTLPDTMPDADSRTARARRADWYRATRAPRPCRATGDTSTIRWTGDSLLRDDAVRVMRSDGVPMHVLLPCDHKQLLTSTALPPSIYSAGDELFPAVDFVALQRDAESALAFSRQAMWNPQPVTLHYGIDGGLLRYNRIEGVSAGIGFDRALGAGYTEGGLVRVGIADWQPNAELFLQRGNVATEVRATAYRRLAAANDWGNPLGLGASITSLLFGRDDGFYFRAAGAEVTSTHRSVGDSFVTSWRLFGEQQATASPKTNRSLAQVVNGTGFRPNIDARQGIFWGGAAGAAYSWGSDPRGTTVTGNARLEAATGVASYGRAMTEVTITRGLGDRAQATVTGAAGSSLGSMPAQRWWYLGGPFTVHGHEAGAASGDAFWLGRFELARGHPMIRPLAFADLGWAGPRDQWLRASNKLSGVGGGVAFIEGLVRVDVARGLAPTKRWRADVYFEIR